VFVSNKKSESKLNTTDEFYKTEAPYKQVILYIIDGWNSDNSDII